MEFRALPISPERGPRVWVSIDGDGIAVAQRHASVLYRWNEIAAVSFEPRRGPISLGAFLAFGVIGLLRRVPETVVTVQLAGEQAPVSFMTRRRCSQFRRPLARIARDVPEARGLLWLGDQVIKPHGKGSCTARPDAPESG